MSTRRNQVDLVNSLIEYVSDIKPYHTKLKNSSSEIFFEDSTTIQASDNHQMEFYHQNVWGKTDAGGEYLVKSSDFTGSDLTFRLPPTVFPRFSISDNDGQSPIGDDPIGATIPWNGANTSSHFTGANQLPTELPHQISFTVNTVVKSGLEYVINYNVLITINDFNSTGFGSNFVAKFDNRVVQPTRNGDVITLSNQLLNYTPTTEELQFLPAIATEVAKYVLYKKAPALHVYWTDTGRYQTPFHQGSRVYVNGVLKIYGVDYSVDISRNFIQFFPTKHPTLVDKISINLMKVDRFFISYVNPFTWTGTPDYFDIVVDSGLPQGHQPIVLTSTTPSELKPLLVVSSISGAQNGDVWRVTAISDWKFSVQKIAPTSSSVSYAYFMKPFSNGTISFIIDKIWLNYYIGDTGGINPNYQNTYSSLDKDGFDTESFQNPIDITDFQVNLALTTQHGVTTDPQPGTHFALNVIVDTNAQQKKVIGEIKLVSDNNGQDYYAFALKEQPVNGTYIELRVEQNGQLNPWVNPSVNEGAIITIVRDTEEDVSIYDIINGSNPFPPGGGIYSKFVYNFNSNVTVSTPLNWDLRPNYSFRVYKNPTIIDSAALYRSTYIEETVKRFTPKYFTVDGPRSMSFSIISENNDFTVYYTARLKNDLCGITWFSEDTKDHISQKYSTNKDYRNCIWSFNIELSDTSPQLDDELRAPSITVVGRDLAGQPVVYIIPIFRYATNPSSRSSNVVINWNLVKGGFFADQDIYVGDVDRIFISGVVSTYEELGGFTPLPAPVEGFIKITNNVTTGASANLTLKRVSIAPLDLGMCTSYDDSYDQTPQRLMENLLDLGYRGSINHYCGMSIFPEKTWTGDRLEVVDSDNTDGYNVVNTATIEWHRNFAKLCAQNNLRLIQAVSFEMFSENARFLWTQRDINDNFSETGYIPPSNLLSPCVPAAMSWISKAGNEFAALAVEAGLEIIVQVGEPWWWYNPGTRKPCIYDFATRVKFNNETGLFAPDFGTIDSTLTGTPYDEFKIFLRKELGLAVLGIRDDIKAVYPTAKVSILPFFPTILDRGIMEFINYPIEQYSFPNLDIFQTEGYDWLIEENFARTEKAMTIPIEELNYPPAQVEYLAGFAPEQFPENRLEVWKRVFKNIDQNLSFNINKQYVWAYSLVMRDSITLLKSDNYQRFFFGANYYSVLANTGPTNTNLGPAQLLSFDPDTVLTVGQLVSSINSQLPGFNSYLAKKIIDGQLKSQLVISRESVFALEDNIDTLPGQPGDDQGVFKNAALVIETDITSGTTSLFSTILPLS